MLYDSLHLLLEWSVLASMLVGILLGVIIGAIPGLGPTVGIALLIPVTFAMSPIPAMLLLLGVYQGGIFGGSIAAILLNVPGTPASAATCLDGYPMALKGEGGKALKLALYASIFGNVFSCVILILIAQPLASMALDFGPVEIATLLLLAMSIIVLFGGDGFTGALLMLCLGVAMGFVGLDPISGQTRLTFGNFDAEGGLSLIPVLIGLFAVSEVLIQAYGSRPSDQHDDKNWLKAEPSASALTDFLGSWRTLLRSSAIGTFFGILPGIGSTVPAFVSYNLARARSRFQSAFGKGASEGVVAPESANNAVTGGALIPMLSLGIPGDAVTAVLLGAFTLQGLAPGPFLFRDHGIEMYAIFIGLLVASIPTIILSLILFKAAIRIVSVRSYYVFPAVLVMAVVGTYAVSNSFFDVWVMLAVGVAAFFLRMVKYPIPPLLIGLILGPPFEENMRQAYAITPLTLEGLVDKPIALIFILITVVCFALSAWKAKRKTP